MPTGEHTGFFLFNAIIDGLVGVTTLRQRRIESCDKFAGKLVGMQQFQDYFSLKEARASRRAGVREQYLEKKARCDRLVNSPSFTSGAGLTENPEGPME